VKHFVLTLGGTLPHVGGQNAGDNDIIITTCNDGSYCCGYNNTACCLAGQGVFINGQIQSGNTPIPISTLITTGFVTSLTTTITTVTSAAETSTPTTSPLSSPSPNHSGFPTSAKIGIGVGVPVAIAIVILGWLYLRERRQRRLLQRGQDPSSMPGMAPPMENSETASSQFIRVVPTPAARSELASGSLPVRPELEANNRAELQEHGQRRN
jgi:hypothetical protein